MRSLRTAIAVVMAVALAALVVAPSATAAREKIETKIVALGAVAAYDDNLIISGKLVTKGGKRKWKCRQQRSMLVWVTVGDGTMGPAFDGTSVHDGTVSSDRGAWALMLDTDRATQIEVKVSRRVLNNGTICKPASVDVPV